MSDLDSGAVLDCLLNYASAASVAVKSATATWAVLKPAAVETVGRTVWVVRFVFDGSETAERQERGYGKQGVGRIRGAGMRGPHLCGTLSRQPCTREKVS